MFKFVLSALVSLLFVISPAPEAKAAGAGERAGARSTQVVKKARVARPKAARRAKAVKGPKAVRRVVIARGGKRKIAYQRVTRVNVIAPRAMSAGDLAGLNLTRDPLDLRSSAAFVLDQGNSEVLFEKNASVALPIASLTKLMTGLIVVEAKQDMLEVLTVTEDDVDREKHTGSRLRVGARLTRGEMLHIALMSSENRAASALGRNYPGGINAFVAAMNNKARLLGMTGTRYVDSSGLSSRNVASARDLAKLVVAAHHEPLLREYSTDEKLVVDPGGRQLQYSTTNQLVKNPEWQIGLQKTGFINEAGRCLVMQAMVGGRAVVMVFLDSKGRQSRTADAGRMRRWLEAFKPSTIALPAAAALPSSLSIK